MFVYKCDICKKEIKDNTADLNIRHELKSVHLCESCAKPIAAILKKKKLLEIKK